VQVADGELGALDVDGEVDFAASAQILDVAVASMLWPARYSPSTFLANLLLDIIACCTGVDVLRKWRKRDGFVEVRVLGDEGAFAVIPGLEDFGGGRAAEDARVDEASELDAGDVAGGAVDAFEVPDGFGSVGQLVAVMVSHQEESELTASGIRRPGSLLRSP